MHNNEVGRQREHKLLQGIWLRCRSWWPVVWLLGVGLPWGLLIAVGIVDELEVVQVPISRVVPLTCFVLGIVMSSLAITASRLPPLQQLGFYGLTLLLMGLCALPALAILYLLWLYLP